MKKTAVKKLRVAAGGLALLALSSMFNAAAQAQEAPAPVTAPAVTQMQEATPANPNTVIVSTRLNAQDAQLAKQIQDLGTAIDNLLAADQYARYTDDPALQAQVDNIIATLQSGADGNLFAGPDGFKFLQSSGLSAFSAGVILSIELNRPDLVDAFLAHGANPSQAAPDKWTPMDYAAIHFYSSQINSKAQAEIAFTVITKLTDAGAKLTDAQQIAEGKIKDYKNLVASMVGAEIMAAHGIDLGELDPDLVINGSAATRADLEDETELTERFLTDHGAKVITPEYSDAYPGGPEPYDVVAGDTVDSIAARYYAVMGQPDAAAAAQAIAGLNHIAAGDALEAGKKILIPVPPTVQVGQIEFGGPVPLKKFAENFAKSGLFYKQGATAEDIMRELARVNGLDEAQVLSGAYVHPPKKPLVMLYRNDSYDHVRPLTPPPSVDPDRKVSLVIIETKDYHGKRTYGVATSTGYGVNRSVDFDRFFVWDNLLMDYPQPDQTEALRAILSDPNNPLRDKIVFSHSMGMEIRPDPKSGKTPADILDARRDASGPDTANTETTRMVLDELEAAAPIIFSAAGNEHDKGEGPYRQSFPADHSPRAMNIGAAGKYPVWLNGRIAPGFVISPYSSYAADICAPLPTYIGEQQEGTSFSTPLTATLYRQMSEWYGDRLSYEEIMAAAMMTADTNVLDFERPDSIGKSVFPTQFSARTALFRTNGAGLPFHDRCGAGVLNIEKWNDTLKLMLDLRAQPGLDGKAVSETSFVGAPALTPGEQGQTQYVYRIPVTHDMTLGKMTFVLSQYAGAHSDITVRAPSGFSQVLPRSMNDITSSYAFAYEDVKAGQFIEILSDKELAPNAQITVRGEEGDNLIARLRNELQARGAMHAPLSTFGGQKAVIPPAVKSGLPIAGDNPANDDHVVPDFGTKPKLPQIPAPR